MKMSEREVESDDSIERFAESLRNFDGHKLTSELSKFYHDLKSLDHRVEPGVEKNGQFDNHEDDTLAIIKRKIGALEEEIGRRKKEGAWTW
jgi:hypothetical protein